MKHSAKPAARSIDHGRFGYARVSTRGQTLEVQLAALAAAAVAPANVFAEKKSGRAGSARPQWEDVRSRLRPGDTLVVSKLDRMGRDMREIMETAWSLQDLGAKLEILSGPLAGVYDPRGMGKIFFAMLAGFAEMEREMMIERTNDGLAQAAAEGRHGGRRPVISTDMTGRRPPCLPSAAAWASPSLVRSIIISRSISANPASMAKKILPMPLGS